MAKRDVQIEISAKDKTGTGLKSAESALKRFANAQKASQERRSLFAGAEKEARDAAAAYRVAADETANLGRQLSQAKRPSAELRAAFESSRAAARAAKAEFVSTGTAFASLSGKASSVRSSYAAFDRSADALAKSQRDVATATAQATTALRNQATVAPRTQGAAAPGRTTGIFGLKPHEVQNLSYQVNDLFTQIASGTSVTQAFAQQGGQIAQIFPQAALGVLRLLPVIALVTAAISPFVAALVQVENRAKSLKVFNLALTASGNGANYSAAKLADLATSLDAVGGSLADAQDALKTFVGDAVAPAYLERFGKAAINLAKVLKVDVTDAAKQVSTAFTGNVSDILSLDDSLHFLTATERAHIEALKASGREAEARTESFAIFERRYDDTASKMNGPWSQTLKNFDGAWRAFVNYVNFIDFTAIKAEINSLIGLIERLTSRLPGARQAGLGGILKEITDQQRILQETENAPRIGVGGLAVAARRGLAQNRLRNAQAELRTFNDATAARQTSAAPDTTTRPPPTERRAGRSDNSAARESERRAAAQAEFLDGLQRENEARAFQMTLIAGSEREARILSEIEQARLAALRVGLTLTTDQATAIRASVGAQYDATTEQEAFNEVSRAALELARARGEIETRAAYIARNLADERLTSESALYAIRADQLGQAYDIEEATRRQAAAEKAVTDQFALRSELQNQVQFAQDVGDTGTANALLEQLDAVDVALVKAIDDTIAFWQAMGGPDAEAAILRLNGARAGVVDFGKQVVITGKQVNDMIASGAVTAFDNFAKTIVETGNAFGALRNAFLQFASDFLSEIAQIILKKTVLNIVDGGGKGGGLGGSIASVIGRLFHTGGVVGKSAGPSRAVSPFAFNDALRYHTGGVAGFQADEVPAILKRGEEVLTESDPRHRKNSAGGGGTTVVNVFDPADFLERALSGAGERILLNHVSRNSQAFKAAIG